jgi:hypothetical protein
MAADLTLVGEVAAEAIVRTTLAGIGEGDTPFKQYSQAYQELIDSVGGKPQQTVNLRGLFYHKGQKRAKFRSEASRRKFREGRQAFIGIRFLMSRRARRLSGLGRRRGDIFDTLNRMKRDYERGRRGARAIAMFQAKTGVTRPARGIEDRLSEMSLDLIKVQATDFSIQIIYRPRSKSYMIRHNQGDAVMPQRKWFTLNKAAVKAAMLQVMTLVLEARAQQFNFDRTSAGRSARGIVSSLLSRKLTKD